MSKPVYASIRVHYARDTEAALVHKGEIWVNDKGVAYIRTLSGSGWQKLAYQANKDLNLFSPEDEEYVRESLGLEEQVRL